MESDWGKKPRNQNQKCFTWRFFISQTLQTENIDFVSDLNAHLPPTSDHREKNVSKSNYKTTHRNMLNTAKCRCCATQWSDVCSNKITTITDCMVIPPPAVPGIYAPVPTPNLQTTCPRKWKVVLICFGRPPGFLFGCPNFLGCASKSKEYFSEDTEDRCKFVTFPEFSPQAQNFLDLVILF